MQRKHRRPLILVANDDGVQAEGLRVLVEHLRGVGRVVVVAPDQQRSAASHSLTLHRPLRVYHLGKNVYAVDGTPTDCVNLAVNKILSERPALIVSGINHGANLGDDVHYSGTVSAAVEGGMLKIPSIAVSQVSGDEHRFPVAARFAARLARRVLQERLPSGIILNVNVPNSRRRITGYEFTVQGRHNYTNVIVEKIDPRGQTYYWIGGDEMSYDDVPGSDGNAIRSGKISITPIHVDMTDRLALERLKEWTL